MEEVTEELIQKIEKLIDKITPEEAKKLMIDAGIVTKKGNLTKYYK